MIHVENLTKYYRDFCAVDGISLDIVKGEIVGLLGPNGAGKTTTLRMLTGYFLPTSGEIRIKDYSVYEDLLAIKRLMGYLPESAPLYQSMLVYDYLDYVANIRGLDRSARLPRIRQLADLCGLDGIMHQPIGELSKGLKQRVGLAHAMMNDPEILVLDEPTSGLDPNQIVEIREIVRRVGEEKTVILSTHILSEVEATCNRIVIINRGRLIADGDARMLRQSIGLEKTVRLDLLNADFPAVKSRLETVEGIRSVREHEGFDIQTLSVRVACHSDLDPRPALYQCIKETEWILVELHQETQNLETVFRELTKEDAHATGGSDPQ